MSLFSKLSSISMQQVVNLIEDEDESWPEEAESLSPRVKQARRCKVRVNLNTKALPALIMMALEDGCLLFRISLAAAALEAFNRKFGEFSEENWHSSSSGRINKKLVVCAAFLDPFEHSQLKTMCDLAPGLNYDMIKKTVINEVRLLTPVDFVRVPVSSRCARFAQGGQNAIEKEVNSYTALLSIGESPLNFWRNSEKYFPYLATLARYLLSVPASSSPSERAFKELRCIMVDFTRNQMSAAKIASLIHIRTSFLNNI
uniref:HAT C-terminal dimerisation domain-containing protein n=1 Tax=Ditylenchus dipsaci TaxID=166011 RepID=A0A915DUF1_9BILA